MVALPDVTRLCGTQAGQLVHDLAQGLRALAEEGAGGVLHVTERAEDSHRRLGIQPPHTDHAARTLLNDLYEAFPGDITTCGYSSLKNSKDAVCELQRFQEEEWCTIVAQLGGEEQGGVVSKSLGHIVRLAGVLKALTVAAKSPAAAIQIPSQENEDLDAERNCHEKVVEISVEDVSRAIELGKYFLEQKLSMTFMVSTGFFRNSVSSSNSQHMQQQQQQSRQSQDGVRVSRHSMGQMLPPLLPGQAGQVGAMTAGPYGLPLGVAAGFSAGQHAMAGVTSAPGHPPPSNPLPQQQQQPHPPFFGGYGAPSAHAIGLHARNVTSSQPATSTPSSATSVDIDVTQLPATWAPTTPEEELAEMSQAAEFVQLEPAQFVAVHARRVKRLLECFDDGCGVSATTAAQKSIAPPVRVAGTNNRHPAWASALFFQKVADLGLGAAEQVRHPTNGRVYWRFKRKTVEELTEKNYQLLQYLRVDMVRFSRLGQPSLHVPGLEADAPSPAGSSGDTVGSGAGVGVIDEAASNSSSKGDKSPCSLESPIKQEVL
nr:hypothetical protein BaRGS_028224 [Batillaria attramentaria]